MIDPQLRTALHPLAFPAAAAGVLIVVAWMFFSMAGRVSIPYDPRALFTQSVYIDRIENHRERVQHMPPRQGYFYRPARSLLADAYPGVSFKLSGAAVSISVPVETYLDLTLTRDPVEASTMHRENPNFTFVIDVVGVRHNGYVLAEPVAEYERLTARKANYSNLGIAALLLTLVPAGILFMRIRRLVAAL